MHASKTRWCLASVIVLAFLVAGAIPAVASTVDYYYDGAGRLIQAVYQDGSGTGKTISYIYDANGNLLKREVKEGVVLPSMGLIAVTALTVLIAATALFQIRRRARLNRGYAG